MDINSGFNYDFHAPMFVDFENMDNQHHNADEYFEIDHEAPQPAPAAQPVDVEPQPVDSATLGCSSEDEREPDREKCRMPANLVTHWADKPRTDTPRRKALRKAVDETVASVANSPKLQIPERRSIKRLGTNLPGRPRFPTQENEHAGDAESDKPPKSPAISRWKRVVNQLTPEILKKSQIARKLKSIAAAAPPSDENQAAQKDTLDAQSFKNRLHFTRKQFKQQEGRPAPKPLQPTNPVPFKLATSARRLESSTQEKREQPASAAQSCRVLASKSCTVVQPFRFQRSRSTDAASRNRDVKPFVSTAELLNKFQRGTPERFRRTGYTRGRSASPSKTSHRSPSPIPTRPRAPNLTTQRRSRPTTVLSHEQRELLELEQAKRHQFKATAISQEVMEGAPPTVCAKKRPVTVPQPFHFHERSRSQPNLSPAQEVRVEFHAKPVPQKILQGPVGIPARRVAPVVRAQSPDFALKVRQQVRKRHATDEDSTGQQNLVPRDDVEPEKKISRCPSTGAHRSVPIVCASQDKKTTVVQPFSFMERDAELNRKRQQRLEAQLEEERRMREFKAKPVPDLHKPINLPIKEVNITTEVEPFHFELNKRLDERMAKWNEEVQKELNEQREAAHFKARPATVLERPPFAPVPCEKPPCQASKLELHTERRAADREVFDMVLKQKEAEREAMKRQLEQMRQQEAEKQVQLLRKETVHKALPVRHFKPLQIQPSDRPITNPVSPRFSLLSKDKNQQHQQPAAESDSIHNLTFDM